MAFADFYRGKRVLVTGHTGFRGAWLSLWLHHLGAEVHGLALAPPPGANLYRLIREGTFKSEQMVDLRNFDPLREAIVATQSHVIFHLAAQASAQASQRDPLSTFYSNAVGTAHLLDAVRQTRLTCDVLVATSEKCYDNPVAGTPCSESDALGAEDVYSMSKAVMELIAQSWSSSFFRPDAALGCVVTARDGNVIGGGDFTPGRIVPDCARALSASKPVAVRNPAARRPWQHVLDSLSGYLLLAARVSGAPKDSPLISPFNFGPAPADVRPVQELVEEFFRQWPGRWEHADQPGDLPEPPRAQLATEKAAELLAWRPTWAFAESVKQSARWYQEHTAGNAAAELRAFTLEQIRDFEASARTQKLAWADA